MKSFFGLKEETTTHGKTVVFTFGRFQPPTKGHQLVFDTVKNYAEKIGAEHRIYFSRTNPSILTDPSNKDSFAKKSERALQNPLYPEEKHEILNKLFPTHNIINKPTIKHALHVLKDLSDDGVNHAIFVGDGERSSIADSMAQYVNHDDFPNIKSVSFIKSGDRDPDAEGVAGISGTKIREHAVAGDHDAFHAMMPDGTHPDVSKEIMQTVRHSINRTNINIDQLKSQQKPKKTKTITPMVQAESLNFDDFVNMMIEEDDPTRKRRDHRMYGWGKSSPSAKQLSNRKKKNKRTVARRKSNASGRTKKGDESVELDHKNGNANDNSSDNLRVVSRYFNRSRNNNK
jgi:hypothetical protein